MELLHCINNAGTRTIVREIGYKRVKLPQVALDAIETSLVRIWHNHPSQGSISDADWMAAGVNNRTEILAVNESGTIYVGRILNWPDKFDAVMNQNLKRLAGLLDHVMQRHTTSHKVFDERLASCHLDGHLLNLCLAECGVVRYAAQLSDVDAEALVKADRVGLVEVGRSWALNQIKAALA